MLMLIPADVIIKYFLCHIIYIHCHLKLTESVEGGGILGEPKLNATS